MPNNTESKHKFFLEQVDRFVLMPVVHHSYEFALAASRVFSEIQPVVVAVEYPAVFQGMILRGISRLPRISVVGFGSPPRSYIRIEPADPFVEVIRLALENQIHVRCMDLAVLNYPQVFEPFPDTYAAGRLGHYEYCRAILEDAAAGRDARSSGKIPAEQDLQRESAMAYHLQQLSLPSKGDVLVLCGISHLSALKEMLLQQQPRPFQTPVSGKLYHLSTASLGEVMGCFPFLTAVYEEQRKQNCVAGIPSAGLNRETEVDAFTAFDTNRAIDSAVPVVNDDSTHFQVFEGKKPVSLEEFAQIAHKETASDAQPDRHEIQARYLMACRSYYEHEIGDRINPQQLFLLDNFSRKYANVKYSLLPDFYELLIAGRSCVSSHFCFRMWEIGTYYPAQHGPVDLEIIELRARDIYPLVQKVRMNPHPPLKPRSPLPRFLRRNEKQRKPTEQFQFSPFSICSYQPEDIIIEDYGRYLRSKGKSILSEERKRVRPFETSLLDGIDLRETIRNWHTGNIYVQECMTIKGTVDSLVVIYDDEDSKYPYAVTWQGEHYQESDMAFYATDPEEREVGPGIRKAVYGGFLMTMPPGRLFDVFHDPAYQTAANYAERLLLAAIDYGLERFVLYSAPKPPRPVFQVIAGRYGKRILYIPLAQLSPVVLNRIRTFHILAGKAVREHARDYIW